MKYFIISTPKSGTYLVANILKNLDIKSSNLHIWPEVVSIYNEEEDYFKHEYINFEQSCNIINEEEFAVGHIYFNEKNKNILSNFKKILIIRDHRELWQSAERFILEKDKDVTESLKKEYLYMIEAWKSENDVFVLDYKDLIEKNINKIDDLQKFIFNKIKKDSEWLITKSLDDPSLTKSSLRSGKHINYSYKNI